MLAKDHWIVTAPLALLSLMVIIIDIVAIKSIYNIFSLAVLAFYSWILWFFRDPDRKITKDKSVILSPADGTIFKIEENKKEIIIYIRMYLFDCHIIRMPCEGNIKKIEAISGTYYPHIPIGKGLSASSKKNARKVVYIKNQQNEIFKVVEIAGILAYRTVVYAKINQRLEQGERLGMIRFGSECDIHFPKIGYSLAVKVGTKTKAGKTILAHKQS